MMKQNYVSCLKCYRTYVALHTCHHVVLFLSSARFRNQNSALRSAAGFSHSSIHEWPNTNTRLHCSTQHCDTCELSKWARMRTLHRAMNTHASRPFSLGGLLARSLLNYPCGRRCSLYEACSLLIISLFHRFGGK